MILKNVIIANTNIHVHIILTLHVRTINITKMMMKVAKTKSFLTIIISFDVSTLDRILTDNLRFRRAPLYTVELPERLQKYEIILILRNIY